MELNHNSASIEIIPYKIRTELNERKKESARIIQKHPTKIPIVFERYSKEKNLQILGKSKMMVPEHMTMADLIVLLRKRMGISETQAIYLLVDNKVFPSYTRAFRDIYQDLKDEDGFLYITYASEQVYGNN